MRQAIIFKLRHYTPLGRLVRLGEMVYALPPTEREPTSASRLRAMAAGIVGLTVSLTVA